MGSVQGGRYLWGCAGGLGRQSGTPAPSRVSGHALPSLLSAWLCYGYGAFKQRWAPEGPLCSTSDPRGPRPSRLSWGLPAVVPRSSQGKSEPPAFYSASPGMSPVEADSPNCVMGSTILRMEWAWEGGPLPS